MKGFSNPGQEAEAAVIVNENGAPQGAVCWWSRGESNPRPQAFHRQFYMRSQAI